MEKSIFNFKIQRQDNSIIDLHEKNLYVNSFRIISLSPEHIIEYIDGRYGSLHLGTNIKERKITAKITVEANDYIEFDTLRDEIYRIFNPLEKYYIIRDLQPNKRIEVSVSSEFDIDYIWLELGEFQIDFVVHSPFFESTGTTLNPSYTDGYFQLSTNEPVQYTFRNQSTFKVWNEGDIAIDPCLFPLKIKFEGASNNLTIINHTTGDRWQYNGSTVESDTIRLDGIRSLKNDSSIFGNTNKKLITLEKGFNQFEIIGATSPFILSFDFRFYYI